MIQYQPGTVVDTSVVDMKSVGSGSERCKYGGRVIFWRFCFMVRKKTGSVRVNVTLLGVRVTIVAVKKQ